MSEYDEGGAINAASGNVKSAAATKAAIEKAAAEWRKIDAAGHCEMLTSIEKLAVISHLRVANSKTGEDWAGATWHAHFMGVSADRAERVFRELRKKGVFELVKSRTGKSNTLILSSAFQELTKSQLDTFLEDRRTKYQLQAPPASSPPVLAPPVPTPPVNTPGTPPVSLPGVPPVNLPPTPGASTGLSIEYPPINPASKSSDDGAHLVAAAPVAPAPKKTGHHTPDGQDPPPSPSVPGLQKQRKGKRSYTDERHKLGAEVEGFNGETWEWVSRLARLDAIDGLRLKYVHKKVAEVSRATSPQAVRAAIEDLERLAVAQQLQSSAVNALMGFARKAGSSRGAAAVARVGGVFR